MKKLILLLLFVSSCCNEAELKLNDCDCFRDYYTYRNADVVDYKYTVKDTMCYDESYKGLKIFIDERYRAFYYIYCSSWGN